MPRKDLMLVGIIVIILALMVIPLNQSIIDVLIAINISIAVLLLMVAVYLKHPSDFSTFPSVILLGTAFRLALSIGTTRLILSEADGGQIIETFGDFVVSGSVAIGLVIFTIITVVQFLVVTKGAERVAEVGARFALDALPGKQMSIDADLRVGNIEQEEATALRKRLDRDSQFFGAMDGAMKFVKGDAIAGLIIIMINLIGGVAVGISIHGLSFSGAISVYSLLTIGDGLVAQIPALIMSLCAGIVVTRAANAENSDLGSDIFKELIADPKVPGLAAIVVLGMGFIPGFPLGVFAAAAGALMLAALGLRRAFRASELEAEEGAADDTDEAASEAENPDQGRSVSTRFICHLGTDIAAAIDLNQMKIDLNSMFDDLAHTRGITFPVASVRVSELLQPDEMIIELDDVPVHRRTMPTDRLMVSCGPELSQLLEGDPDDVLNADWVDESLYWVARSRAAEVKAMKLPVVELADKLPELVFRIYEQHLGSLFSKDEFDILFAEAVAVDETGMTELESSLTRPALFQIMRYLVEDGVPLRPLRLVIDSLTYWAQTNEGAMPAMLAECLRGSLRRQLCHVIANEENVLGIAMVDPALENTARKSLGEAKRAGSLTSIDGLVFDPDTTDIVLGQFQKLQQAQRTENSQLAVVVSSDLRRRLRNFLASNRIHLPVLAPHEISPDVKAYPIDLISIEGIVSRSEFAEADQEDLGQETFVAAE